MPDTDRLINKDQGDSIIAAIQGITSRLQEMYTVDDALSGTSENPVQNKVVKGALDGKVDTVSGKGLSSNDYTTAEKEKLAGIEEGAQVNTVVPEDIESTQTASGNPLTLTDCAPINAESLVVELLPKQDLHGYQYPWVGGSGKNLIDVEDISSFTASFIFQNKSLKAGTYVLSFDVGGTISSDNPQFNVGTSDGTINTKTLQSGKNHLSFNLESDTTTFRSYCNVSNISITNIQVEIGVTPTDFAPYSNICPITGYTECEVDDVGKNLVDASEIQAGYWDVLDDSVPFVASYSWQALPKMRCSGGENYTFSCKTNSLSGNIAFIDKNGKLISYVGGGSVMSRTVETPANCYFITAYLNASCTEIQLEKGSTATTYEPYHSSNATIQFGQTVYGGEVDFLTGVVTVDSGFIASYAGETLPSTWISDRDAYSSGGTPTTGAQVCYKLATPQTIQLTPAELKLLKDTNYISSNGTTINLGYQPDNVIGELKGMIQDLWDYVLTH